MKKKIKNLNLKINLGDKIGIMGKSGSGKTTIIDLLMGMLKPDSGCIYLNKQDINNLDLENSDLFSYIPQKSFVLDDNIKNNITFGKSDDQVDIDYYNLCS